MEEYDNLEDIIADSEGFDEELRLYNIATKILGRNSSKLKCKIVPAMGNDFDHPLLCYDGTKVWILPAKTDLTGSILEIEVK